MTDYDEARLRDIAGCWIYGQYTPPRPRRSNLMKRTLLIAAALVAAVVVLAAAGGCNREFMYRGADGSEFVYRNNGFDTQVGKATVRKKPDGSVEVELEKVDSQSKVAETAADLAATAKSLATKVP